MILYTDGVTAPWSVLDSSKEQALDDEHCHDVNRVHETGPDMLRNDCCCGQLMFTLPLYLEVPLQSRSVLGFCRSVVSSESVGDAPANACHTLSDDI